ncbi:MAG TPA: hypothetical protein VH062_08690 [Polyangiaceae bacterium]|jgi:hypothetical protein|nr:hypothetical protein [Polyangiaceae bacterium]
MTPSFRPHGSRFLNLALILFATVAANPARDDENPSLPPLSSDELSSRAAQLFDAIKAGQPELGDAFFFPREPFLPLKDVKDPGRYHKDLVSAYHHDIRDLHAARKNWDGTIFRGFKIMVEPKRVPPGHEWNKIGYYRTVGARLEYEVDGKARVIEVHTLISWDGRWYVTHLAPIRH